MSGISGLQFKIQEARRVYLTFLLGLFLAGASPAAFAEPNLNGETGYINMPGGRIEPDGTLRMGYSFADPYANLLWASVAVLPRVELYARFVRVVGVPAGTTAHWQDYGDYKDKVASAKFVLLEESWFAPNVVFGINDVQGTGLFRSKYLAASKRFGDLDTTLGIGKGRIRGGFAGARYAPESWDGFALAAEYDANNYKQD
ncbi:MAG: YjbH domain-containing protein, partial [Gallionella sp.]|nr:YjbH domain-containing protein [Gallionella sp.]